MKKPYGTLVYEECECHPLPSFGPFKQYKMDYLQEVHLPMFGVTRIQLARPHKGTTNNGVFVKAFGSVWILVLWNSHARR